MAQLARGGLLGSPTIARMLDRECILLFFLVAGAGSVLTLQRAAIIAWHRRTKKQPASPTPTTRRR